MKAFVGESQARNRYTFYARVAKKQGYFQIENTFNEIAENELEHASIFYKKLIKYGINDTTLTLTEEKCHVALFDTTLENLKFAADGEKAEYLGTYPEFARIADEEEYHDIADTFRLIAKIEEEHEIKFLQLIHNLRENTIFMKEGKMFCKCMKCGFLNENIEINDD